MRYRCSSFIVDFNHFRHFNKTLRDHERKSENELVHCYWFTFQRLRHPPGRRCSQFSPRLRFCLFLSYFSFVGWGTLNFNCNLNPICNKLTARYDKYNISLHFNYWFVRLYIWNRKSVSIFIHIVFMYNSQQHPPRLHLRVRLILVLLCSVGWWSIRNKKYLFYLSKGNLCVISFHLVLFRVLRVAAEPNRRSRPRQSICGSQWKIQVKIYCRSEPLFRLLFDFCTSIST